MLQHQIRQLLSVDQDELQLRAPLHIVHRTGCARRYPGGTLERRILRTVSRASPNRRAAARSLSPPHRRYAAPPHRLHGDDVSETLAKVIEREPGLEVLLGPPLDPCEILASLGGVRATIGQAHAEPDRLGTAEARLNEALAIRRPLTRDDVVTKSVSRAGRASGV